MYIYNIVITKILLSIITRTRNVIFVEADIK
jgi:hypothetical protein